MTYVIRCNLGFVDVILELKSLHICCRFDQMILGWYWGHLVPNYLNSSLGTKAVTLKLLEPGTHRVCKIFYYYFIYVRPR